jgi:hypothetical protein
MDTQLKEDGQKGWHPTKHEVVGFLNTQQLGRIATLGSNGQPQIANVAFSQNDALELIIGTSETSRKAINIMRDSRVAFEATDPEKRYTVQFEGNAHRLSPEEFESRSKAHFEKLPGSLPFKDITGQAHFLLKPTWVRFSDCSGASWVVTEFNIAHKAK